MDTLNIILLVFNIAFLIGNAKVYRICSRAMGELKKKNPKKPQYWNEPDPKFPTIWEGKGPELTQIPPTAQCVDGACERMLYRNLLNKLTTHPGGHVVKLHIEHGITTETYDNGYTMTRKAKPEDVEIP